MKYLLGLLLTTSLASADGIDNFTYDMQWATISFSLPATLQVPTGGDTRELWEFPTNINYLGGVLTGAFAFYNPPNAADAVIELGYIVSTPPGFVWDPNLSFYQQWPFDYQHTSPLFCCSDSSALFTRNGNTLTFILGNHGDLTITATPEPATLTFLFAGLGALALRKRLARRD